MKTKTYTVYTFEELNDEAKEKAMAWGRDINVDYDWWITAYESLENYFQDMEIGKSYPFVEGVKVKEFDLSYRYSVKLDIDFDRRALFEHYINAAPEKIKRHASVLLSLYDNDMIYYSYGSWEHAGKDKRIKRIGKFLDTLPTDDDLEHEIGADVLRLLQQEYDYLTSDEAVRETIIANGYTFLEDGTRED